MKEGEREVREGGEANLKNAHNKMQTKLKPALILDNRAGRRPVGALNAPEAGPVFTSSQLKYRYHRALLVLFGSHLHFSEGDFSGSADKTVRS